MKIKIQRQLKKQLKADKTVEAEKRAEDAHKQAKRTSELRAIGRKIRKQSGTVDQYQPQPTRRGGRSPSDRGSERRY